MFAKVTQHAARLRGAMFQTAVGAGALPAKAPLRQISTVGSLESLERMPVFTGPVHKDGARGLDKLGVSAEELFASEQGFHRGVARLNASFGRQPGELALTRRETVAAALGIVQAGNKTRADLESAGVHSLMYHLLRAIPAQEGLMHFLQQHALQIVEKAPLQTLSVARPQAWWTQPPAAREAVLRQFIGQLPYFSLSARQAVGDRPTIRLDFDDLGSPLAARAVPSPEQDRVQLTLDQSLLEDRPSQFADLGPALVPSLLAHELLHAEQQGALDVLNAGKRYSVADWEQAIGYALSLATQNSLFGQASGHLLVPHLPHEKEAWALSACVIRAQLARVDLPEPTRAGLKDYLVKTFCRYAFLQGEHASPLAATPEGLMWDRDGRYSADPQEISPDLVDAHVTQFLGQPL